MTPTLSKLITVLLLTYSAISTPLVSGFGSGCYDSGASLSMRFVDEYVYSVCYELSGDIAATKDKVKCINTSYDHGHSEKYPGSYFFSVYNLLGASEFNSYRGCIDTFIRIGLDCSRGGDYEIIGPGYHWDFVLDPNVDSCP